MTGIEPQPVYEATVMDTFNHSHNSKTVEPKLIIPHLSRNKNQPWWERDDPIYEPWLLDENIVWTWHWKLEDGDYTRSLTGEVSGQKKKVKDFVMTNKQLTKWSKSDPIMRILSSLHGWHQLNAKQLCAFTGIHQQNLSRYTVPLFKAGILMRGEYTIPVRNERRNFLWKLNYSPNYKRLVKEFKLQDFYNTTFGIKAKGSLSHNGHNLTVAEIGLRWLETTSVFETQGISPERLNAPKRILGEGTPGADTNFNGDTIIVRHDGLRIVLEITRSSNHRFLQEKMVRWMKLFLQNPHSDIGMHVIFVNCSPHNGDSMSSVFRRIHAEKLGMKDEKGVEPEYSALYRAQSRITFADYRDWFPGRWMISDEFTRLTSIRRKQTSLGGATTTSKPEDWEKMDLFGDNQIPFKPNPNLEWQSPWINLPNLKCTPPWHQDNRSVIPHE